MQKLNVRFPSVTTDRCNEICRIMNHNVTYSVVARAAMEIGLRQLEDEAQKFPDNKLVGMVHIGNIRANLAGKK